MGKIGFYERGEKNVGEAHHIHKEAMKAKSEALKKKKEIPKHYQGNTNSEGGIPFGRKPR